METLFGMLGIGSWGWALAILFNRTSGTTLMEKWVLGFASVFMVLYVIGSLAS